MTDHLDQRLQQSRQRTATVDEDGLQHADEVAALAISHGFDVRVVIGMERRRDRDTLGVVDVEIACGGGQDRLGIGADHLAQARRQPGQVAALLHVQQQLVGAVGAGGEHHVIGGEGAAPTARPASARPVRLHDVPAARTRPDGVHGRHRDDLGTGLFGQVEVVLDERVLRSHRTSRHAGAAVGAASAGRAGAAEERVVDRLARLAEEHADRGVDEGVADSHLLGDLADHAVGGRHLRIRGHAEHA